MKIEIAVPNFFFLPLKKMTIESVPATGRVYFIFGDRIVAVGKREDQGCRPDTNGKGLNERKRCRRGASWLKRTSRKRGCLSTTPRQS